MRKNLRPMNMTRKIVVVIWKVWSYSDQKSMLDQPPQIRSTTMLWSSSTRPLQYHRHPPAQCNLSTQRQLIRRRPRLRTPSRLINSRLMPPLPIHNLRQRWYRRNSFSLFSLENWLVFGLLRHRKFKLFDLASDLTLGISKVTKVSNIVCEWKRLWSIKLQSL